MKITPTVEAVIAGFWLGFTVGVGVSILLAPSAHADQASYLGYLASHNVNTPLGTPERNIALGLDLCQRLHQGMSPDQVIALANRPLHVQLTDIPGVLDAAQHELCPDTLGR